MKEYLKYNLNSYLHKDKNKYVFLCFVPLIIIVFLLFYSYEKKAYSVYETNAETLCDVDCNLTFYYPYTEGFYYDFIKINEKSYEIEDIYFGDIVLDSSNEGIQNITLKVKEYKGKNQEFVKLQIYKNKEKLIKKIVRIMKER